LARYGWARRSMARHIMGKARIRGNRVADALLTLEPDSLRLNLDPLHWAICREWLPQGSFRMPIRITPLRVIVTAMTTLLMVFAIQRVPGIEVPKLAIIEARAEQPPPADLQKTDTKPLIPVRQIELTRTAPAPDPKPPVTADAPAKMPPVLIVQEEGRREQNDDICSRHHLQKVYTRGGRSWRCR
jgi:hypothetical protein